MDNPARVSSATYIEQFQEQFFFHEDSVKNTDFIDFRSGAIIFHYTLIAAFVYTSFYPLSILDHPNLSSSPGFAYFSQRKRVLCGKKNF